MVANPTGKGLRNVGSLRRKLRLLPEELKKPIQQAFKDGAQEIEYEMLARVPRDQGILAENISHKVSSDGFSAKIGFRGKKANRAGFYAKFQEFGTTHHSAQPFLIPGFESAAPRIVKDIARLTKQTLRRAKNL